MLGMTQNGLTRRDGLAGEAPAAQGADPAWWTRTEAVAARDAGRIVVADHATAVRARIVRRSGGLPCGGEHAGASSGKRPVRAASEACEAVRDPAPRPTD
jgi:hypothetical protein